MYTKGQTVKLSEKGVFKYARALDKSNPTDVLGFVEGLDPYDSEWWFVTWENGYKNCYQNGDLIVVEEPIK